MGSETSFWASTGMAADKTLFLTLENSFEFLLELVGKLSEPTSRDWRSATVEKAEARKGGGGKGRRKDGLKLLRSVHRA